MYENTYRVNIRNLKEHIDSDYIKTLDIFKKSVGFLLAVGLRARNAHEPRIVFEDRLAQEVFNETFTQAEIMRVIDITSFFLESLGDKQHINIFLDLSTLMDDYLERCYKPFFMNIVNITFNRFHELEIVTKQNVIRRSREY